MRNIDPEPVLAKLAERKQRHDVEIRQFQEIERWRDRLLSEPKAAMDELLKECPNADHAVLAKPPKRRRGSASSSARRSERASFLCFCASWSDRLVNLAR